MQKNLTKPRENRVPTQKITTAQVIFKIKSSSFDELVCQTAIQSAADKEHLCQEGYIVELTEQEFSVLFTVDPRFIWYSKSLSMPSIYFNPETLAACLFPIQYLMAHIGPTVDTCYKEIQRRECEVSQKSFAGSIHCLTDTMQLEYFQKLIEMYGAVSDLYRLFFSIYYTTDYGFAHLDQTTVDFILSQKTARDKEKTAALISRLPETITVYRGGGSESTPPNKAWSWTTSIQVATFFMGRLGETGAYLVAGTIQKDMVIECDAEQDSPEIIARPGAVVIKEIINMRGIETCAELFPSVTSTFHKYREKIKRLSWANHSDIHGKAHAARVLLLCLMLGELMGLSKADKQRLAMAATYHDLKRDTDDVDSLHGRLGREYYNSTVPNADPIIEHLIEYHSRPDADGHAAIEATDALHRKQKKTKFLYDIFKDADALDRVRFGFHDLDINQLRTPIAKTLPLVAYINLKNIQM